MRKFTRTPYYTGPNDPERGQVRGPLQLGETVQIETVGGHDQDYPAKKQLFCRGDHERGYAPRIASGRPVLYRRHSTRRLGQDRNSRHGGRFLYGFYRNGGPHWGSVRLIAPVRDGWVDFPPDFVVPVRPMIGYIAFESVAPFEIDHGGNLDFNAIQQGSAVHLRAQKPGGLLMLGDVHARMGDGELPGTGVEIDSTITLRVDRSPGFPCSGPVVEKTHPVEDAEEFLTSGQGETWEDALKIAWSDMVSLIAHRYDTTSEYANLIVGTIGDARPGYSSGRLNMRGRPGASYVTCQLAITKKLRRTGTPYTP
ncbi:MAG: acetamidase/formamidase family protein [candidate division Zixibacteria bacterium]|nr:acetamidase/formamidase family protein [candidate division Zixibacteria bacterium]